MDTKDIDMIYFEIFKVSPGYPWEGFPDKETATEYYNALQKCVDTGIPLTEEQRKYYGLILPPDKVY